MTIHILGAGPSGLSAAIVLARGGLRVVVHERRASVGARFHDDYQGLENWSSERDVLEELERVGIRRNFACEPIRQGTIYNARLKPALVGSPSPVVYLVRRGNRPGSLDSGLAEQARAAGAELRFGSTLSVAEATIVAGGPSTPRAIAVGVNFRTELSSFAGAILSESLAPRGYAYLLIGPSGGTLATVLFGDFARAKEYLQRAIETYAQLLGTRIVPSVSWGGYGSFRVPKTAARDGRLYVGEAAGFQDLLFGFGIRLAMRSGILAAQSILNGLDYDALWKARMLRSLISSRLNRSVYSALGGIAAQALWIALKHADQPDRLMRWLYNWWPVAGRLRSRRAVEASRAWG